VLVHAIEEFVHVAARPPAEALVAQPQHAPQRRQSAAPTAKAETGIVE
jgi:hypothetical protein